MNKLISLLTALIITLGSVPCIADEYDVPPVEVDDVLSPSEKPGSEDAKSDNDVKTPADSTKESENDTVISPSKKYDYVVDEMIKNYPEYKKDVSISVYEKNNGDLYDARTVAKHKNYELLKNQLKNFLNNFVNIITSDSEVIDTVSTKYYKKNHDMYIHFWFYKAQYEFYLTGDIASTWFGSFKLNNTDELIEYIKNAPKGDLSEMSISYPPPDREETGPVFDFKNLKLYYKYKGETRWEDLEYRENVEFDVTVSGELEKTVFEEIGGVGGNVHCTIDHYAPGHYFILTLTGKNGTKMIYERTQEWVPGRKLAFFRAHCIEDNKIVIYNTIRDSDFIYIPGKYTKENKLEIGVRYGNYTSNDVTVEKSIPATNVKYNKYFDDSIPSYARVSLQDLWNMPQTKEEYTKQLEEQQKEQDKNKEEESTPERTVSKYKYKDGDGVIHDYRMKYIAIMPVRADRSSAPAWYKKLGDNVKVSFILLCRTLDGEDFRDAMLVRFTGMNGTQWFYISGCKPNADAKDDVHTVDVDFDALVSFDGKKSVYNSVEHDSLKTTIKFDDDDYCIENVTLNIGDEKVNISNDEIKVIGSRKALSSQLG